MGHRKTIRIVYVYLFVHVTSACRTVNYNVIFFFKQKKINNNCKDSILNTNPYIYKAVNYFAQKL